MLMFKKIEGFMELVENNFMLSNTHGTYRTTPVVTKSLNDFEAIIGKRLFKREKFGMSLTQDGSKLYDDLKDLYEQERKIIPQNHSTSKSKLYNDLLCIELSIEKIADTYKDVSIEDLTTLRNIELQFQEIIRDYARKSES
ncbi:hypothetical protein COJ79_20795 [Bacillus thuringiensis]|uniref:LysR family transcriptional regulator n=1 Tax=Bacillus thuringiensis TaxID=1428 RepID=UPI000BF923C6|nr:LysR family transcriptional regulator [Bacillus thuringiensis]PFO13428.1 hypothetical protein COJ79_20795 [Bacillus thuringiensis]